MKVIGIIAVTLIGGLMVMAFLFSNSKDQSPTVSTTSTNEATTAYTDVLAAVNQGGQLIDVRTQAEFDAGHIKEAVLLPLDRIQAGELPKTERDRPLYVYCRSGNRSAQATSLLKTAGFSNVVDLGAMTNVATIGGQVVQP